MTIKVRAPDGTIYTSLWQDSTTMQSLLYQAPDTFPFYWNHIPVWSGSQSGWATGFQYTSGRSVYPPGVYTFWTESNLNGMKDNYDYTGKTVSAFRTITIEPAPLQYHQLILSPGWNFVSTPKFLAQGNNTGSIFGNVDMGGHSAFMWDGLQDPPRWVVVLPNTSIRPLYAVWIYSTSNTTVNLTFDNSVPPLIAGPRSLAAGWNAVGFTGFYPTTAHNTYLGVGSGWVHSMGFDAITQRYEPAVFNGDPGELTQLYPTKGYWLYMRTAGNISAIG
jgi:hypothetical protein